MMDKGMVAVIYKSHYGATKCYAEWISAALGAELREHSSVKAHELDSYEVVIYGGGLYASGINGIKLVTRNCCRNLVVFTVGLADPVSTDYSQILEKNIPADITGRTKVFHLRGDMDYRRLSRVHRGMMAMMKKMVEGKKPVVEMSEEDRLFLETYGKSVDFKEEKMIEPLVAYIMNRYLKQEGQE